MRKKFKNESAKLVHSFYQRVAGGSAELDPFNLHSTLTLLKPSGCNGAFEFKWDYMLSELLSKYCGPSTVPKEVRSERAISKLMAADAKCLITSRRLRNEVKPWWYARAADIIARTIGDPTDYLSSCDVDELSTFTSGAAVGYPRRSSDVYYKYASEKSCTVTERALPYAKLLIERTPLWDPNIEIVRGNALFTVNKKADIDRAACKEPNLNQALQSGVGRYYRKCLRNVGIDLNDQTRNQRLAKRGSLTGLIATLDLSSASDTISIRLILDLFGPRWFALLSDLRSPETILPNGENHVWSLFSTMGNGFTFELESLLFYAIAKAASEEDKSSSTSSPLISVYGDDIICESQHAPAVMAALEFAGFTINPDKSFFEGPFRESCGAHYYNGVSVKPFYIRKPIDSPQRVIWLLNTLREWAADSDGWCDPSIYNFWLHLRRQYVPPEFLGGRDTASISEVVSPEEPRKSFKRSIVPREIDGVPAILRWFNFNAKLRALTDRVYGSKSMLDYSDTFDPVSERGCAMDRICCIGDREVTRISDYVPSVWRFPIFPQETVTR